MKTVIIVLLILAAFLLGRSAGFDNFLWFLREEHPDVLDALRDEMDKEWEDDM